MTDDDRLLEIATRLMNRGLNLQESRSTSERRSGFALDDAEALLKKWRERTGAREERGQDVDDELLRDAKNAIYWKLGHVPECRELADRLTAIQIQRARAAGKEKS